MSQYRRPHLIKPYKMRELCSLTFSSFSFLLEIISFCPGWPQTYYIAKDSLDPSVFYIMLDQQVGSTIPGFPAKDLTEQVILGAG